METENHGGKFYVLDTPEWINVIALTPDDKVILVEQYRFGIQKPTLEIPGGMVDIPESPFAGAKRELLEETGYVSGQWTRIGKVSSNPAIQNNYTHLFLARDCTFEGGENPDTHERINVHTIPLDRFLDLVQDGTIHHAIVVAAVARFLLNKRNLD